MVLYWQVYTPTKTLQDMWQSINPWMILDRLIFGTLGLWELSGGITVCWQMAQRLPLFCNVVQCLKNAVIRCDCFGYTLILL